MKHVLVLVMLLTIAAPARAQLGGIGGALKKAQQAQDVMKKVDDLTFSEEEETQLGQDVSLKIRQRFGVVQDPAVHKYVTLAGMAIAQQTERAKLNWTFIVLDTDGVNAFASPGGFVHITRGALGLIQNESELAAVLGHEIGHVVRKHTINAIKKNNAVKIGTQAASTRAAFISQVANAAYDHVLENAYDRGDELDADKFAVETAPKLGYAPTSLADFLGRLEERNKNQAERNGLFASHPETQERIKKIGDLAKAFKTTAKGEARYKTNIKYQPAALSSIAVVTEGSAGLAGSPSGGKEAEKKEEPKKGVPVASLKTTTAPEKQSAQVSASGGARGLGADRAAKGGSNPNPVKVTVSAAEIDTFKKGIA